MFPFNSPATAAKAASAAARAATLLAAAREGAATLKTMVNDKISSGARPSAPEIESKVCGATKEGVEAEQRVHQGM